MFTRWVRFNSVGVIGACVHLSSLALLTHQFEVNYLLATVLAIEAAVVHNFIWHQKWTWKDRPVNTLKGLWQRLAKFHFSNGLTSMLGNLVLMKGMVDYFNVPVMVSSVTAILVCAVINFLLSDQLVFKS